MGFILYSFYALDILYIFIIYISNFRPICKAHPCTMRTSLFFVDLVFRLHSRRTGKEGVYLLVIQLRPILVIPSLIY